MVPARLTVTIAVAVFVVLAFMLVPVTPARATGFTLGGGSADYAVLYEGGGNNTLQITNVTVNGNVGDGNTGKVSDSGPSVINGRIDISAANTGQFSTCGASCVVTGGVNFNVGAVTTALSSVNTLNTTLGALAGTNIAIGTGAGQTLTINASLGTLGSGNEVFNVTAFSTTNSNVLTINGDGLHNVVLNFNGLSANFNNQVVLNGLSHDQVLYNFVGGSNLTGGPTLQINNQGDGAHPLHLTQGIFLDPNGSISVVSARLLGRVFGGDSHDMQIVSGTNITASVPEPTSLLLLGVGLAGLAAWRRWMIS